MRTGNRIPPECDDPESATSELALTELQRRSLSLGSSLPVAIGRALRDAAPGPVRLHLTASELADLDHRLNRQIDESKFPHTRRLEAMPEWIFDREYPICLGGGRACPDESVMRDLADYRAALRGEPSPRGDSAGRRPVVPRSDEPPFDPDGFDREVATAKLRESWTRNAVIPWRID